MNEFIIAIGLVFFVEGLFLAIFPSRIKSILELVRNAPEKIFVTEFSKYMPDTLITRDIKEIIKFKKKNKNIIVKPLYGNGGEGVFYVKDKDSNFNVILENFLNSNKEQFIVQSYIPEVKNVEQVV